MRRGGPRPSHSFTVFHALWLHPEDSPNHRAALADPDDRDPQPHDPQQGERRDEPRPDSPAPQAGDRSTPRPELRPSPRLTAIDPRKLAPLHARDATLARLADAPPCAPGEYCAGVLCLPDCNNPEATPCGDGSMCLAIGSFSGCVLTCDPAEADACGAGQVCVPGLNVCQPSCIGLDSNECADGLICDADLGICVPPSVDATTGDSTT